MKFFQYSNSNVVEYDGVTVERPVFDLILGTKTMNELGIILDFKQKIIIDEIELPMTSINDLPASRYKALALTNSLKIEIFEYIYWAITAIRLLM